ncbi:MAG: hypothetical protein V8P98_04345 [Acutalibacteraceae bacterium]
MCKHELKITVRRPGEKPISLAEFKKLPLLEKMRSRWFGNAQKLMVIVPQDSVQKIEIKEV